MRQVLALMGDVEIVGEPVDSAELMQWLSRGRTKADVLLCAFFRPGGRFNDNIALLDLLHDTCPRLRVVIITRAASPLVLRAMIVSGAHGLLLRSDPAREIAGALRAVARGRMYIAESVRRRMAHSRMAETPIDVFANDCISARETEVLRRYTRGMTIGEIATALGRSIKTVSTQRIAGMKKLGLANDRELYEYAFAFRFAPANEDTAAKTVNSLRG
ncbi:response regulator transcription factor [Cupriavidus basilensis]|uniref:Two-component response regulator n=1 Tax=Cupriavidus basilensis TaxID=68895 RepID=A0A0C4YA64_9BURK|nr:response regulator transcription factor [Cupriavidus basilensis]AJG19845.1 Two-component response regulator [Cupriavidus basilensis]